MTYRNFEAKFASKTLEIWERDMPDGKIEQFQIMAGILASSGHPEERSDEGSRTSFVALRVRDPPRSARDDGGRSLGMTAAEKRP